MRYVVTVHPFILSRVALLRTSSSHQPLFLRLVPWEISYNHAHWGRAGTGAGGGKGHVGGGKERKLVQNHETIK